MKYEEGMPKVSVRLMTYMHFNFISEAIESCLMQRTDFPFEIVIGDDFSTDGTREICLEYQRKFPDLVKVLDRPLHGAYWQTRQKLGRLHNFVDIINNCKGKYIALLDGDDYWTDPLKLQKQVDFLEANPDYSIVWTKYHELKQDTGKIKPPLWESYYPISSNFFIDLNNIFKPYCTYTLTAFFRKESLDLNVFNKLKFTKDNTLYAISLTRGNGMLLNFYSGVYRLHDGGVYSSITTLHQKYQSYLNLKEITQNISATSNLKNVRNGLLTQTLELTPLRFSKHSFLLLKDAVRYLEISSIQKILKQKFIKA